jgi:hypothetical protein
VVTRGAPSSSDALAIQQKSLKRFLTVAPADLTSEVDLSLIP